MRPITTAALACAASVLALPAGAQAATVTYEGSGAGEVLVYRAAPGEANRVGVQPGQTAGGVTLYDSSESIAGAVPGRCEDHRADAYALYCPAPAGGVRIELGDGRDSMYVSSDVATPVSAYGGAGDDELSGNDAVNAFYGEDGNDTITAYGGADVLDGGPGADTLNAGAGADRLSGGDGDDLLLPDNYEDPSPDVVDGGPGVDRIERDYTTRYPDAPQPPSSFTLGGGADDGRPGEGDDVRNVERLTLNTGAKVVGTEAAEYVKLQQVGDRGDLSGMGGDDELRGGDGADTIDGGSGDDLIDGGYGDDTITGGPGRDRISADQMTGECSPLWCKYPYGNDVIFARDGEVDSITCGAGTDRVVADANDVVAPDCETVERPAGGGGAGTGTGSGPVGGGGTPGAGGGTAGSGEGPAAGPVTGPLRVAPVPGQRLRIALAAGLRVRVGGGTAGTRVTLKATVLGRTVATGTGRVGGVATLRFTATARRTLARRTSARLTVVAGASRASVLLRR